MLPRLLFASALLLPVLEIFLMVRVGAAIGALNLLLILLLVAALGLWLTRRAGRQAWTALQEAARRGVVPEREVGDASLVMAGGLLLMLPGFVSDVVGLVLILPFTRPLVRRRLAERARRKAEEAPPLVFPPGFGPPGGAGAPPGPVVRGEVIVEDSGDVPPREPGTGPGLGSIPAPRD